MSHSAGFEAWVRNQKGLGKHGFFTAEDLLRQSKSGKLGASIEATDDTAQELPPLTTTAVRFDSHGLPEEVLYVDKQSPLPEKLAHGEVLVHMLAACINDEDLLRVQARVALPPRMRDAIHAVPRSRRPDSADHPQRVPALQPHKQQVG